MKAPLGEEKTSKGGQASGLGREKGNVKARGQRPKLWAEEEALAKEEALVHQREMTGDSEMEKQKAKDLLNPFPRKSRWRHLGDLRASQQWTTGLKRSCQHPADGTSVSIPKAGRRARAPDGACAEHW